MWVLKALGAVVLVLVAAFGVVLFVLFAGLAGVDSDSRNESGGPMLGVGSLSVDAIPEQYRDVFVRAAQMCPAFPATMMAAQVNQESRWDPGAQSHAGAMGIAQIMPGTWREAGLDHDGDGRADPWNPADALPVMASINCENLERVDGLLASGAVVGDRLELALAAYNAGLGAVQRHRGIPPYAETQDYVATIARTVSTYAEEYVLAGGSDGSSAIVAAARQYLGVPYVWGGESSRGVDCSGLVLLAVKEATGKSLPHLADLQARSDLGQDVPANYESMRPGDVIAFSSSGGRNYGHIGIYLGDKRMIHAPRTGDVVKEAPINIAYWERQTWKVKRF